jgi:cytochrome o ubiquinol oxidase subunit III
MSEHDHALDHHHHEMESDSIDVFGFWVYILTDCILFATLFAVFVVMQHGTHGLRASFGPILKSHVDLMYVLGETVFLLLSNFCFGLAILALYRNRSKLCRFFLMITFILGACFVAMEIYEFYNLSVHEHFNWTSGGAASSFFVLVGTHGFHVTMGLIWIMISIFQLSKFKINRVMKRRLTYLGLFWNFLDIVWIFLFTVVYLNGAI